MYIGSAIRADGCIRVYTMGPPGCQGEGLALPVSLRPVEDVGHLGGGERRWRMLAKSFQCPQQVPGRRAVVQRRCVGLLAQFLSLFIDDDRDMEPARWLCPQGPVNLLLLGGHAQQV